MIEYEFVLDVQSARYAYKLLRIEHGLEPYPLRVVFGIDQTVKHAITREAFISVLSAFFKLAAFRQLISNLRSLARESAAEVGLSLGEFAALGFFRHFELQARQPLSRLLLDDAIGRLMEPLRTKARDAMPALIERGLVVEADGFLALTDAGESIAYKR